MGRDIESAYERIIQRTDRDSAGCLISGYSTGSHGYAQAWDGVTVVLAHRIVWEWHNGPVPDDMTIDHRCHNRRCVELSHLRLLTNEENARDNGQVWINPGAGKFCSCGEEKVMREGATYKSYCRTCQNRRRRARRAVGKSN